MFGSKARKIEELENDKVALTQVVQRSKDSFTELKTIVKADPLDNMREVLDRVKEIVTENGNLRLDLDMIQTELDEAQRRLTAPKPKKAVKKRKK